MSLLRSCDKCRLAPGDVERYSVRRYRAKPSRSFESAGSIDLCRRCWEAVCKPRMRQGDYRSGPR